MSEPITADALAIETGWREPAPHITPGWFVANACDSVPRVGWSAERGVVMLCKSAAARGHVAVEMLHIDTMDKLRALVAALKGEAP